MLALVPSVFTPCVNADPSADLISARKPNRTAGSPSYRLYLPTPPVGNDSCREDRSRPLKKKKKKAA